MMQSADDPLLLVHAYCDGELDPAHALALERRLTGMDDKLDQLVDAEGDPIEK